MVARESLSPAMVAVDRSRPYEHDTMRHTGSLVDDSIICSVYTFRFLRSLPLEEKRTIYIKRKGSPIGEPFVYEVVPKDFASLITPRL